MSARQLYKSYLIRLWPACHADQMVWRASLEDPHTGQRVGFSDLDQLIDYLKDQISVAVQEYQSAPDVPDAACG